MTGSVTAGFVNGDAGIKPTSSLTWEKVNITAEELAELAQTIPYEIMLGFGPRIPVEVVD